AEDGIRDLYVTGVQTCALPICHVGSQSVNGIGHFHPARGQGRLKQLPDLLRLVGRRFNQKEIISLLPGEEVEEMRLGKKKLALRSEERRVGKECGCRMHENW